MKAKLIMTTIMMVLCAEGFAQDIIHKIDGQTLEAKVLQITDDHILYKTFDNLDGPDYLIATDRVTRIVFENGTERTFTPATILVPSPYVYDYYDPYGPLEYRRGHYYDRYGRIYSDRLDDYLGVSLYGSEYRKANSQYLWGMWLTSGGAAILASCIVGGAMLADYNRGTANMHGYLSQYGMGSNDSSGMTAAYIAGGIAGAACIGVGIPLWIRGNRKLNAIADDYNQNYGRRSYGSNASVNIGTTAHGIGLALNF